MDKGGILSKKQKDISLMGLIWRRQGMVNFNKQLIGISESCHRECLGTPGEKKKMIFVPTEKNRDS